MEAWKEGMNAADISCQEEEIKSASAGTRRLPRFFNLEMISFTVAALAALVLIWILVSPQISIPAIIIAGIIFTVSIVAVIRLVMDPDSVRAHQSDAMLQLASESLDLMKDGLSKSSAQDICALLLPNTAAVAVSITDKQHILGYAGIMSEKNRPGSNIKTQATYDTLKDGELRVLYNPEDIGFIDDTTAIGGAIVVPLNVGRNVEGTLKFYYRSGKKISETQKSIAQGFGMLLSTQMAAVELEEQRQLATSMELKMLQSQINPHFLFNTINTIASLIRTDPAKARDLLREFAVFYRSVLEDSGERISLEREIEQTKRYFMFEVARFGEDRAELVINAVPAYGNLMVPPFIIQPIVENAVKHAMPSEGKLTVSITVRVDENDVLVSVSDNGVGMTEEERINLMHPANTQGLGIAVKNVFDRLKGFFGPEACMEVRSKPGRGTTVTLRFPECAKGMTEVVI
ncbi:MAG: histidine kinase [Eggerthellaceae bacterium]|nr:histidine kinase [Eggerthellaceae bacterium]